MNSVGIHVNNIRHTDIMGYIFFYQIYSYVYFY